MRPSEGRMLAPVFVAAKASGLLGFSVRGSGPLVMSVPRTCRTFYKFVLYLWDVLHYICLL